MSRRIVAHSPPRRRCGRHGRQGCGLGRASRFMSRRAFYQQGRGFRVRPVRQDSPSRQPEFQRRQHEQAPERQHPHRVPHRGRSPTQERRHHGRRHEHREALQPHVQRHGQPPPGPCVQIDGREGIHGHRPFWRACRTRLARRLSSFSDTCFGRAARCTATACSIEPSKNVSSTRERADRAAAACGRVGA